MTTDNLAEWVAISVSLVIGIIALSFHWQSLSISNTALKLSKLEKKPSFSYLIQYDKDKGQYFFYIENKSKNRATGLLVLLVPKISHVEKAEMRKGRPIEVPTNTEKIFAKDVYDRYQIDNFYETSNITKDEHVWLEGEISYKNMETDDWENEPILHIKIEK